MPLVVIPIYRDRGGERDTVCGFMALLLGSPPPSNFFLPNVSTYNQTHTSTRKIPTNILLSCLLGRLKSLDSVKEETDSGAKETDSDIGWIGD